MCALIPSAAQRKSDSLQDRIDALEREREDTEHSLEEAVLQVFCCLILFDFARVTLSWELV